jgi:hypothetical protein
MTQTVVCFKCNTVNTASSSFGRRDECTQCHSDLHSCLNCIHYDQGSYNECKEPSADYVKEKDRANFCDYFSPSDKSKNANKKDDLLAAAEALFKKT